MSSLWSWLIPDARWYGRGGWSTSRRRSPGNNQGVRWRRHAYCTKRRMLRTALPFARPLEPTSYPCPYRNPTAWVCQGEVLSPIRRLPQVPGLPCKHCDGTGRVPDDREIGRKMRRRRIEVGLSLRALAARLGLSPAYLSDLETGRRRWSPLNQKRYWEVL